MKPTRPLGILTVAALMILFGSAEIVTGFTHRFFTLATADSAPAMWTSVLIGALYASAGVLILPMRQAAAVLALVFLALDVAGRIVMAAAGFYPVESASQIVAILLGTAIVIGFAAYIRWHWSVFR